MYLGIDIGGTAVKIGLVDEAGGLQGTTKVETDTRKGPEALLKEILSAGWSLLEVSGFSRGDLEGIGVGCAGLVSARDGVLITAPNLKGWENVPLGGMLASASGVEVYLDNDANAFAYGESCVGAARSKSFGVFITLGTGVGGGLLLDGEIYRGCNGFGAELGHIVLDPSGPVCECGNRGCFESFVRSRSIVERAAALYAEAGRAGELVRLGGGDAGAVTPEQLCAAASSGDEEALQAFRDTGRWIGIAIGGLINVFNPQVVVIGGGVAQAGDPLFEPVRHWAGRFSFSASFNSAIIVPASLGENSGLVGAALEARDKCGIPCR
jgi:glucokinase